MPAMTMRLLFAVWTVPLATAVYFVITIFVPYNSGWQWKTPILASVFAWSILAAGMGIAFRGLVRPTRRRLIWTVSSAGVLVVAVSVAYVWLLVLLPDSYLFEAILSVCSWVVPVLWLGTLLPIWRETAEERAARLAGPAFVRVVCPKCGYNLSAHTTARCPECGRDYTIAELIVLQPGRGFDEQSSLLAHARADIQAAHHHDDRRGEQPA